MILSKAVCKPCGNSNLTIDELGGIINALMFNKNTNFRFTTSTEWYKKMKKLLIQGCFYGKIAIIHQTWRVECRRRGAV